jgi:hypothetical protein
MNEVPAACIGRKPSAPEHHFTATGKLLVQVSLVVGQQGRASDGERMSEPLYVRVRVWEPSSELLAHARRA